MPNRQQDKATVLSCPASGWPADADHPLAQDFATGCAQVTLHAYAIAQWTALATYALNAIVEIIDVSASNGRWRLSRPK